MKKNKEKQNGTAIKYEHPGRPRHQTKWPEELMFPFKRICAVNPDCELLTNRKNLERDMYLHKPGKKASVASRTRINPRSQVCEVVGLTAEPDSKKGLGRRGKVYCLRVNKDNAKIKAAVEAFKASQEPMGVNPRKVKKAKPAKVQAVKRKYTRKVVSTSQTPTADKLDAIHAALSAPESSMTVPAVKIEPAPAPAPETAPVTPPVIEAPATSTLPLASLEPTPVPEAAPVATLANS